MAKSQASTGSTSQVTRTFSLEKETPGALRYQEEGIESGKEGVIGALYIRKASGIKAQRITVTITTA